MMMGIIIADLSKKLSAYLDSEGGSTVMNAAAANGWLDKFKVPFKVHIIDDTGKVAKLGAVVIQKK